ncbi:MAG: penicillin acylase family protein, partial [Alphaproteobacteria bacterium]
MNSVRILSVATLGAFVGACSLLAPLPGKTGLGQRLAMIPAAALPLARPVTIYWDRHQIPFIEASSDEDLAFALGLVHAHLRLGQMELMRRVSQGRIAEMAGPIAVDIDHSLRILNFGRAAAEIEKGLPPASRKWVESFVRGINHYQKNVSKLPAEFTLLGMKREPWKVRDILTIGRLASSDVNWLVWFRLLKLRGRPEWKRLWVRLLKSGGDSMASFRPAGKQAALDEILRGLSRSGSNSLAIAGRRTRSGAALMANDPHLGLLLPNLWLIAGVKSPSYHTVGLMVPGLPFFALGRNKRIAWGGTNMRAASSDLYDVSKLKPGAIRTRRETIKTRWWFDRTIDVRESPLGPIISDAPLIETGSDKPLALAWVGHQPSDEITAMLKVSRAGNFAEFKKAFESFAVSAQNMLYADVEGNIGQVMAMRLPVRKAGNPRDLVLDPSRKSERWRGYLTVGQLPASYNPKPGYLASANNRPAPFRVPLGYFFSANDRVARMAQLMRGGTKIGIADLKAVQNDVYLISAVKLRDLALAKLSGLKVVAGDEAQKKLLAALEKWDGRYRVSSKGPVAFELFYHALSGRVGRRLYKPEIAGVMAGQARAKAILALDIERLKPADLKTDLQAALASAADKFGAHKNWGEMHRLALRHPLGQLPLVGGRFRFVDVPAQGSNDTLWKTAHGATDARHDARYGSNARHISDLSDPDANYFVLLGGQDGWFNSANFTDQVDLWLTGKYVKVPLTLNAVRKNAVHTTTL